MLAKALFNFSAHPSQIAPKKVNRARLLWLRATLFGAIIRIVPNKVARFLCGRIKHA